MKTFSAALLSGLESQLQAVHSESNQILVYSEKAITISVSVLEKLRMGLLSRDFEDRWDEIDFFRNRKPQMAAKLIYYSQIYDIESNRPVGSKKCLRRYFNGELDKLERYFCQNREFYRYYRTGDRSLDYKYFIRGKHDLKHRVDGFYFQADHRFSTSHDYRVAMILANDATKEFLETQLAGLAEAVPVPAMVPLRKPRWTGSKVALIELVYALHAEGMFNNAAAELKEVMRAFETAFDIDLGQFNRTFIEMRARKCERTKFLDALREKLLERMDRADEN